MDDRQIVNLLGALSLALSDAQADAARRASDLSPSACAALVSLGPYPGTTIGALARILGLSHSVAVRLTEALAAGGLVERGRGSDRRQVSLRLSPAGESLRSAILQARAAALGDVLAGLSPRDRQHLGAVTAALLTGLTRSRDGADHICRLCDEDVCPSDRCPVECEAVRIAARSP